MIAPALLLLSNLTRLVLSGNPLSGSIPSFSALARLQWLDLHAASLTGSVPDFQALVGLERLELYGNFLTGTLPSFASLARLSYFDVEPCFGLVGSIPSFPTSIETVYLGQNMLNGTIHSLASLVNLKDVWAHKNAFTGTIPKLEALEQLRELFLNDNHLTGTLPAFPTLVRLEHLSLGNNLLSGALPSYAPLVRLQQLDLSGNAMSGLLPSFATNVELERLDLSRNAFSGTAPAFATLAKLKELRLARNFLSGTIPSSSWRALRALELVDVSENQLSGNILLFTHDAQLPPLGALFVDVSSNQFGGDFAELPLSLNLTSINIRNNRILCPYPLFSLSIRVLRSTCMDDWTQLGTYAGIGAGAAAIGGGLYLGIKKLVSGRTVRIALFARSWLTSAVGLVSDALSFTFIVQYLEQRSNNCALINELRVFVPQLAVVWFPPALRNVLGNMSFAEWIQPANWPISASNGLDEVPTYTARFVAACRQAPECTFDASLRHVSDEAIQK